MFVFVALLLTWCADIPQANPESARQSIADQSIQTVSRAQNIKWIEPRTPITNATTPGDADSLFKITSPGSYYLVDNIHGVDGKIGIEITSSAVTVDLMGFDLWGGPGTREGILAFADGLSNISINNGSIRNWGRSGIAIHSNAENTQVSDLRVAENGHGAFSQSGVSVGRTAQVMRCTFKGNTGWGLSANYRSQISDCLATENSRDGFWATEQCTLTRCTSMSNSGNGFAVRHGTSVTNCSAQSNIANGFMVEGPGCYVLNCTSASNKAAGISVSQWTEGSKRNRIESNHVFQNSIGIEVPSVSNDNFIVRNTAAGNSTNYLIEDTGRAVGPIVDLTTGADFLTALHADHPWANFAH